MSQKIIKKNLNELDNYKKNLNELENYKKNLNELENLKKKILKSFLSVSKKT